MLRAQLVLNLLPDEVVKVMELVKTFAAPPDQNALTESSQPNESPASDKPKRGRPPKEPATSETMSDDELKKLTVQAYKMDREGVESLIKGYGVAKSTEAKGDVREKIIEGLRDIISTPA